MCVSPVQISSGRAELKRLIFHSQGEVIYCDAKCYVFLICTPLEPGVRLHSKHAIWGFLGSP